MMMKTLKLGTALCLLAAPAFADDFRMQTFLGATAATTTAFEDMAAELAEATDGAIDIQVFPAGSVVGATDTIDAITNGLLDGQYTGPTFFAGLDPAFAVFGDTLSAYPDVATRARWFSEGGGLELGQALYADYGMHLICVIHWPGEQIPSTVPIRSVADFDGITIRAPGGLPSDLLTRAGAQLVNLSPGDAITALETGALDASDLANVGLNMAFGMHQNAPYSIRAGHSMPVTEMSVSMERWDALSADHQVAFTQACEGLSTTLETVLGDQEEAAIAEARDDLGVEFIEFSDDDAATFRAMLQEVWDDWGARNERAGQIVESHRAFLSELGIM
ncbi:TRAP transporter substrate-binding protein [Jannaschia sp. CCS1]|uniref:TRAP transporter substrate-binding protein n=1 Tax=Jannaschia sp. (strain CCS1) TaxID=290400 RepID=UPI000053BDB9|nr:TRAP transporter substrate-binding protein [Jannaschia sp. CCS1]ABD56001.1 TRAP dicarboxylate transporter DctP subunit [Jannaschia sp. CCS1]